MLFRQQAGRTLLSRLVRGPPGSRGGGARQRKPNRRRSQPRGDIRGSCPPPLENHRNRPPSPAGRTTVWVLCLLFSARRLAVVLFRRKSMSWRVGAGQGVVPSGRSKDQSNRAETGVVHTIQVEDGQSVKAGDVLVTLDATNPAAERRSIDRRIG